MQKNKELYKMKIFSFIRSNKYPIAICVIFALVALCLVFFFQGLKKDHSFELFKQKIEGKETERQAIIKEREAWQALYDEQSKHIITLQIKDSLVALQAAAVENRIKEISKPQYVKEKIKAVENLTGNDLLNYINKLPEPNDY